MNSTHRNLFPNSLWSRFIVAFVFLGFSISVTPTNADELSSSDVEFDHLDNIVYGYKDGLALVMNVLIPKYSRNGAGVLVVFSGALRSDPSHFAGKVGHYDDPHTIALLRSGFVIFQGFHGSQPKYTLPEIRKDMPRAVRFVRHHAKRFDVNPNRIGVIGWSSGGSLALHLVTDPETPNPNASDPVDRVSSRVQAAVAIAPATDLFNFVKPGKTIQDHLKLNAPYDFQKWDRENKIFVKVDDPLERKTFFEQCSPINYVSSDDPPTLLLHGDQDEVVPISQSREFQSRMTEVGVVCELIEYPGRGHGGSVADEKELDTVTGWFSRWLLED